MVIPEQMGGPGRQVPLPDGWRRVAELRDEAGRARDLAAQLRDSTAQGRDHSADLRDEVADERDRGWAAQHTVPGAGGGDAARPEIASLQRAARSDRLCAWRDRGASASDRAGAELDRDNAQADRGAASMDRVHASVDGLTGVHTREAGLVELERDLARVRRTGHRLVLAFVDVDHLKTINDTDGHAAGDRLLREVAETLQSALRPYDLVMRFGGDEFLCAIQDVDAHTAGRRFAEVNLLLALAPERGSVTVGLAETHADESSSTLIARADADLYRQRRSGFH